MLCRNLTVSGDWLADFEEFNGTYMITNERANQSTDKPVYKLDGKERFIFYDPDNGWMISSGLGLKPKNSLDYWFKSRSKNHLQLLTMNIEHLLNKPCVNWVILSKQNL